MEKVRVGIIGLGWPGQRHIEAYLRQPDAEIVALCDANETLLSETVHAHGVPHAFTSVDDLLALRHLDAVSICLPNFLHEWAAVAALESGRHVLCEKPLARTVAEGEAIARAVEKSGRVFMMALNNRFRPDNAALKALVDTGGLGDIYYSKAGWLRRQWNPLVRGWFIQREQSGGGPLIDLGVHMLDLAWWYMGSPRPVAVSGATFQVFRERVREEVGPIDTEDLATGLVRFADGRVIIVDASWISYTEHPDYIYCALFGSQGGALLERVAGENRVRVYTEPVRGLPLTAARAAPLDPMAQLYASFADEVRHFLDCVRTGQQPTAPVEHGLDILRMLDALYRSAARGGEVAIEPANP